MRNCLDLLICKDSSAIEPLDQLIIEPQTSSDSQDEDLINLNNSEEKLLLDCLDIQKLRSGRWRLDNTARVPSLWYWPIRGGSQYIEEIQLLPEEPKYANGKELFEHKTGIDCCLNMSNTLHQHVISQGFLDRILQ